MTDQPDEDAGLDPVDHAAEDSHAPYAGEPGAEEPDVDPDHAGAHVTTGHAAVDEVLRSLQGLDGRPVDEHVAAFEQAHEVLRRALSDAGDDTVSREG
ncbi:MAG TPA: hypothetical protein VHO29_13175 [Marmoricola sp.]|nr:hypothetical protein [Marmoricola sp.]